MTNLLEFDDAELTNDHQYAASLELNDHAPYSPSTVGLTLEAAYPEPEDEQTVTVLLDRTRAQQLVDALVRHFGLEVAAAERLRADDARDEALAEKTDTRLGH